MKQTEYEAYLGKRGFSEKVKMRSMEAVEGFSFSAFAEGLLMGLSLVLNLFYLATRQRQ